VGSSITRRRGASKKNRKGKVAGTEGVQGYIKKKRERGKKEKEKKIVTGAEITGKLRSGRQPPGPAKG